MIMTTVSSSESVLAFIFCLGLPSEVVGVASLSTIVKVRMSNARGESCFIASSTGSARLVNRSACKPSIVLFAEGRYELRCASG